MRDFIIGVDPITGEKYVEVPYKGRHLTEHPIFNKGSAFTEEERRDLDLWGVFPDQVSSIELQSARAYESYSRKTNNLERYVNLQGVHDRNETLFYRLMLDHLEEMLPIVYTPTVGEGAQTFSHIFRRGRGLYVSANQISLVDKMLANAPFSNIHLIVVTDGERILGLGDLGVGGMAIPIGKISLYVLGAGIHPAFTLPICIDVGTNNETLLNDPLYLGLRQERLTGEKYDLVIEEFVKAVKRRFPHAILQWEDFGKQNALRLLLRYRDRICSFNDDIQGTGVVALATLVSAVASNGEKMADQTYLIFGLGQAGYGIGIGILRAMKAEGLSTGEARRRIFAVDKDGLLIEGMKADEYQKLFLTPGDVLAGWNLGAHARVGLAETLTHSKATVLIGTSAQGGSFTREILTQLGKNTPRPIILALSNPTSKCECTPEDVFRTLGPRALLATGTRFQPVVVEGETKSVSQCNNMYVFPGVGLGTIISMSPRVTEGMFDAAAKALASFTSQADRAKGKLLPEIGAIRNVSAHVAFAVARVARESGLGVRLDDERLEKAVRDAMWEPRYMPYRFA